MTIFSTFDRSRGSVQAELMKINGEAEAEAMMKKAESWSSYNQAAIFEMLVKILPDMARAVSEPLSKVEKIVMVNSGGDSSSLGASKITAEVTNILAQLPTIIESLGGVDLKKLVDALPKIGEGRGTEQKKAPESKDADNE
jgi:flotillin